MSGTNAPSVWQHERYFFNGLLGPLPISTAKLSMLHTVNDIAVPFRFTRNAMVRGDLQSRARAWELAASTAVGIRTAGAGTRV